MIDAVLVFGILSILFEMVVISMMPPRIRLRVLGSRNLSALLHVAFLSFNLAIHWGSLIGTISGILAFIASILTVEVSKFLFGYIKGRVYKPGLIRYELKELR